MTYLVLNEDAPVLALFLYGTNEQTDLSNAQRKLVADLAEQLKTGQDRA